jgi:WD40 repeat protein
VDFIPDSERLASASYDTTLQVQLGPHHGWEVRSLESHPGWFRNLVYGPDNQPLDPVNWDRGLQLNGERLADRRQDHRVKVWDSAASTEALFLGMHRGTVWSVAFSPDGTRLASASEDRTVEVWDCGNGREVLSLQGHIAPVSSVAYSPDGTRLASASIDGTVKVWDVSTGQEVLTLKSQPGWTRSLVFSADGMRLAGATSVAVGQIIHVWDARRLMEDEKEAESLVRSFVAKHLSQAEIRTRVQQDTTISEPVRRIALSLIE